ncbi:helix-turn-helix domain-containing protein [Cohnella nanjingensis]|uniref:Helix-turn-helix transcriptional regulator n=1 Tax=Cohnella nanjingensis TaxID=1387779 RepID=A0A7X0RNA3_9BACL|nr:helix-turn-helix transcriptional regulator [Cohnella nanjingensis]MBB6670423.1 helix-turn-helix transcriptional regulator [Cohnella nanjingensis]
MDMRKIGALISTLRKEKGMTQAEFAEQLNLSHQAVSKWERGESLPDVGTLPAIGRLLGTTIDDLLTGERRTVEPAGAAAELSLAAEAESLPVQASPAVGERPVVHAGRAQEEEAVEPDPSEASPTSIREILRLAPFLSSEALDLILEEAAEDQLNLKAVQGLAPFVSRSTLARLADRAFSSPSEVGQLVELAPFLASEQLDRLVRRAEDDPIDGDVVQALAPFLSQDTLHFLVERAWNDEGASVGAIQGLAPFLSRERLVQLLDRADPGSMNADVLSGLAPFVPGEALERLIRRMLNKIHTTAAE